MKIITRVLLIALALLVAAYLIPDITVINIYAAIISAIVLGLLNVTLKPILFVLTLPITILTLGLFSFVINAGLLLFVASFIEGFEINGFLPALLGSLIVSLVNAVGNKFI